MGTADLGTVRAAINEAALDSTRWQTALNRIAAAPGADGAAILLNQCRWVEVFYACRPNLPDEADNHLIELAVAARAAGIVTRNLRDLSRGELRFRALRILTPERCLEVLPCLR